MTPQEFTKALTHLGLMQKDFAAIVDVTERQVGRWVAGDTPVPIAIAKLLRMMLAHQGEGLSPSRRIASTGKGKVPKNKTPGG